MTDKTANAEHDLGKLIADVQSLKRDLASLAEHSRGTLWAGASDAVDALGDEAHRLYDGVAKQGRRQVKALSNQVEEQPLLSVLIAFGIGFLGGRILPR
jgi:ElaB/YqjD/DUF883 family membrane-anchored ribosome-binding protein